MRRPHSPIERYEGLRWQPAVEDADWEIAQPGDVCAQPKCKRPAVIILWRSRMAPNGYRTGAPPIRRRWGCCEFHTYGRWVEDGQVWHWKLTEVQPS